MSQRSLIWPLSVILVTLFIIVSALATPPGTPSAAPLQQGYYPPPSNTTPAATATTGTAATVTTTTTSTTATVSVTATAQSTSTSTTTPEATSPRSSPSPTPTLAPDEEVLDCLPGVPLRIEGSGPANTSLLLFFGGRAVGGSVSDRNGNYSIRLLVGNEPGGNYPVEVQIRGTRDVIRELTCRVPTTFTPTPTPRSART